MRRHFGSLAAALCVLQSACADPVNTVDLKPYVGYSPFDIIKADWVLPRGKHVFDGVPWQIDGVVLLYGNNGAQKANPARTNVNDIPVGTNFEVLHLLAAAQQNSPDGTAIAKIHLNYGDGTESALEIRFGDHVRYYMGPWHRTEKGLGDKNVHQAWHAQFEPASNHDEYLRLYHVPLPNPQPEKVVKSISLESAKKAAALMVAAISIGPANATALASESLGSAPFPDLRPRTGELSTGSGNVFSSTGEPVAGAMVKIIAARKYDTLQLNEKLTDAQATTDSKGHFTLPNLPDDHAYRVLIVANGYTPFVYHGLDAKSDPIQLRLERAVNSVGKYAARARVVGPDGKAVKFAQVERDGIGTGGGTTWGGRSDLPEYALTDTNGEFVLSSNEEFDRVQVKVTAPHFAPVREWLPVTNNVTTLNMDVGAVIRGRVLDLNGKPIPKAKLGISGSDRNSEVFAGYYFTTATDDGKFQFDHVPPRIAWNLYGVIASLKKYGALPSRKVTSAAHGETNDLGDLQVSRAIKLAGNIKTRYGEPAPKGLKINLGFDDAWDYQTATADKNGRFIFQGLYPAKVELYLNSDGWKLSGLNRSLSVWNSYELSAMLVKDKDDLVLMIEKGKRDYSYENNNGSLPSGDDPSNKEIAGVENIESNAIVIAGSVVDDKTGQPIAKCRIVPGYKPSATAWGMGSQQSSKTVLQKLLQPLQKKQVNWYDRPFWMGARAENITNGTFSIPFVPLQSAPMFRVEAAGYEPFISEPIPGGTNNMVVRLGRGNGPSGIVLLPDGKPATNAKVLFASTGEQYGLHGRELDLYGYRTNNVTKTSADGSFSFMAKPNAARLYFAHPDGYNEQLAHGKDETFNVKLKPWAMLSGTLIQSNGTPAAGVELGLTLYSSRDWDASDSLLHYNARVKTDSKGFFLFTNVPPRRVQVQRIVPSGRNGWTWVLQTYLDVEPGITNDLGKIVYDQPPAKPVIEQIKDKLGIR